MLTTLRPSALDALLFLTLWALREGCTFLLCGESAGLAGTHGFSQLWADVVAALFHPPGAAYSLLSAGEASVRTAAASPLSFPISSNATEGEMVGGYHRPNGRECEEASGDSEG